MEFPTPGPRLVDILWLLAVPSLQLIARRCGNQVPAQKAQLIAFIDEAMRSPAFIIDQLNQTDNVTRAALALAAHGDGRLDPNRFFVIFGVPFTLPTHGLYDRPRNSQTATVAELFLYRGTIPSDLIPILRELLPAPPPHVLKSWESLAESVKVSWARYIPEYVTRLTEPTLLTTEEGALHDLVATLMLISDNKIAVGALTGLPTIAAVRALRQRFLVSSLLPGEESGRADDAIRPVGFAVVARAAGLARIQGGKLELTRAGRAALLEPSASLLKAGWTAWLDWQGMDELTRVRGLKGQKTRGQYFTRTTDRKKAINRALAACPVGRWVPIDDFLKFVRIEHDFAVVASEDTALYFGYSRDEGSIAYLDAGVWNATSGAYARVILLEYAATLGLIDVATIPLEEAEVDFGEDALTARDFSRYFSLAHVRINNLGHYILGGSDTYSGPATLAGSPSLTVLPSLDVVVTDRAALPPNDRAMLERFSTRVSEDVYHLSKERLLEAIESGFNPREAEAFLQRRGNQTLPQTAAVLFADVTQAATSLRGVGPAQIVECVDPHLAVLISHDSVLKALCLLAGERHLAVPEASLAAFRRGLRRLGYALPDKALAVKARKATGRKS